jgi:hypothetical protein
MTLSNNEKKQYIYDNIPLIQNNHSEIISIIESNQISHTNNDNGIFVNIDTISDDIINTIYDTIFYIKNHNISFIEETLEYESQKNEQLEEQNTHSQEVSETTTRFERTRQFQSYCDNLMTLLSEEDIAIVEHSKQYHL